MKWTQVQSQKRDSSDRLTMYAKTITPENNEDYCWSPPGIEWNSPCWGGGGVGLWSTELQNNLPKADQHVRHTSGAAAAAWSDRAEGRGLNTRQAHQERGSGDKWRALSCAPELAPWALHHWMLIGIRNTSARSWEWSPDEQIMPLNLIKLTWKSPSVK